MTREEGKEFANALKNNYTIDFDKIPEFCDLVISALEKNESAEAWYKLLCEKWDSAENKGEWIPVTERLPEVNQNVLATTRWREVTIAERLNIGPDDWFIHEGNTNAHTEDIVAWQPLPEPYKAESEDKE